MISVQQLFVYPIKSLGGFSVQNAQVNKRGLQYDRRYMLVDDNNSFLTQRTFKEMALLQVAQANNNFEVFDKRNIADKIFIPNELTSGSTALVTVWDDVCEAIIAPQAINTWFTKVLGANCRLVYMPNSSQRFIDKRYATNTNDVNSFSDGYPILMVSEASLNDISAKAKTEIPVDRFRPNIVITGVAPFAEDDLKQFTINNTNYMGVKPCARCVVTTIDQNTAQSGKEPLKTLATYRQVNNKILFGQNVIPQNNGVIAVGDKLLF
jgi:uncharacterized protein